MPLVVRPGIHRILEALTAPAYVRNNRNPYDASVGPGRELSTRSEEFASRWAAHNVRFHANGAPSAYFTLWAVSWT